VKKSQRSQIKSAIDARGADVNAVPSGRVVGVDIEEDSLADARATRPQSVGRT
jgi:hypothetical protein